MRFGIRDVSVLAVLVCLSLTVYWQCCHFDFVDLDDGLYVSRNPNVAAGLTWEGLKWAFTNIHAGYWIPVTWVSFMANAQFLGMAPSGFHLVNLLLHTANCLLLFWLMSRLTGAFWRSAFVAALFAVHPLQVEAVAWVTQRKDVLCVFLGLTSVVCWIRYLERPRVLTYLAVTLTYLMALMAKPMAVTIPWVWIILDYWPFNRGGLGLKRLFLEKAPLLVISIMFAAITLASQKAAGFSASLQEFTLGMRLENAIVSYAQAIGNVIWPSNLAVFYPHPGGSIPLWQVLLTGFDLVLVSVIFFLLRRQRPWLAVGWFGFIGVLFPVSGFFQSGLQATADRFSYLCITGLFVMIVWEVHEFARRTRHTDVAFALGGVALVALFTWSAARQTGYWSDSVTLFSRAIAVTQDNYVMHANLGSTLLARGDPNRAAAQFQKALAINPSHANTYFLLGNAREAQGRTGEAIRCFKTAIMFQPDFAQAHNNLGGVYFRMGKTDEAILHFRTAIVLWPEFVDAHNNLGLALMSRGDLAGAGMLLERAIKRAPNDAEIRNNMGILLARKGDLPGAVVQFSRAIYIRKDYPEAQANLQTVMGELTQIVERKKQRQKKAL